MENAFKAKLNAGCLFGRNRLKGNWGVVDVADCANAAKYLAEQGKADSKRLTIDGGSAGGESCHQA